MTLKEFAQSIPRLSDQKHVDKIRLFGWYEQSIRGTGYFTSLSVLGCYDELHLQPPANISSQIQALARKKPKQVLKKGTGYVLERRVLDELESKHGRREATVIADKLLSELPAKVGSEIERKFLDEALLCFRVKAFRAAMVMTWNLAFDHLRRFVFNHHLPEFNARLPISFPGSKKLSTLVVKSVEDFDELKESEFLDVAKDCKAISKNVHKILVEKLTRRNLAAHPSLIEIGAPQAEDLITDLVNNVVLKLK